MFIEVNSSLTDRKGLISIRVIDSVVETDNETAEIHLSNGKRVITKEGYSEVIESILTRASK